MKYIRFFLITFIISGCATGPSKMELELEAKEEQQKINQIIENRPADSPSMLIRGLNKEIDIQGYGYGDPVYCEYFVTVNTDNTFDITGKKKGDYKCFNAYKTIESTEVKILKTKINFLSAQLNNKPYVSNGTLKLKILKCGYSDQCAQPISYDTKLIRDYYNYKTPLIMPSATLNLKSLIKKQIIDKPVKTKYESKEDYDKKLTELENSMPSQKIYFKVGVDYDVEKGIFEIDDYCSSNGRIFKIADDVDIENKSGVNGFGATWSWSHHTGSTTSLSWSCVDYNNYVYPSEPAKAKIIGKNMIAILEIIIPAQYLKFHYGDFVRQEWGNYSSKSISNYHIEGEINKVYFGEGSQSGKVFTIIDK